MFTDLFFVRLVCVFVAVAGAMIAVARFSVVLTAPAVSAELVFGEADGVDDIVDALEGERGQVEFFADVLDHVLVRLAIRIGVLFDVCVFAFLVADIATSNQVVFVLGTGEVDELAGVNERRACNTHVRFLTT